MTISIVQTLPKTETGGAASLQSAAFGSSVTTGNTIIVLVAAYTATTYSCSDTASNTYQHDVLYNPSGSPRLHVFRCSNATGGSGFKITITAGAGTPLITFVALEVSGLTNSSPADGSGSNNTGSSTGPNTASFTTANANDLLVALYMDTGAGTITITAPSGFTVIDTETNGAVDLRCQFVYQIVSTAQAYNPTWALGASEPWYAIGFAYQAAASGPPKFSPEQLGFSPLTGIH